MVDFPLFGFPTKATLTVLTDFAGLISVNNIKSEHRFNNNGFGFVNPDGKNIVGNGNSHWITGRSQADYFYNFARQAAHLHEFKFEKFIGK